MTRPPKSTQLFADNSFGARMKRAIKTAFTPLFGVLVVGIMRLTRLIPLDRLTGIASGATRMVGPYLREHRIGRANLTAAFPEKSPEEIDEILMGVWDNLGRVGAEFVHLDKVWRVDLDNPAKGRVEFSPKDIARFEKLRDDGKGALVFTAHLANWELPALAGPEYGMESAVLFRRPNVAAVDRAITEIRGVNMGEMIATSRDAPRQLVEAVEAGKHVGMLVVQYFDRGVDVTFFGRKTRANQLLARIRRYVECPIHGVRIVRLPNGRFRAELTDEIEPARDASGEIDIQATTQKIMSIIEGWIREYPEQWLWLHRRWR
jgi:KDO2-lipid IV(A) lauroyltransferase